MGRGSTSDKLSRIDQLLGILKSGEAFTASNLADALGVSQRTLMRDLVTLKEQGYPIESEQGRGGGVRLYPRWGIGRLALNYREVVDLLLALNVLEKMDSPLFFKNLKSVKYKLFASFPDVQRPHLKLIRQRILVGELASERVLQSYVAVQDMLYTDTVLEGFFEQKCLQMEYRREDGQVSSRIIEIHYVFLNWPVWYLIAWDNLRAAPRTFRIDRISYIGLLEQAFSLRPLREFSDLVKQISTPL